MTGPAFDLGDDHYVLAARAGSYRHPPFQQPDEARPVQVLADTPCRSVNGAEVTHGLSSAPFQHPKGEGTNTKCLKPLTPENFA
jgi:hypothetical protein